MALPTGRAILESEARTPQGDDRLLFAFAYAGTFALLTSATLAILALGLRSGLGTPRLLVVECCALVASSAFAPLLLPASWQRRLLGAGYAWPLLALAVLLSVGLALWLGRMLAPVYAVVGTLGLARALVRLRRMTAAEAAALLVGAPALGLYALSAQHAKPFTHLLAPEWALIGTLNADSLHHVAIASMLQNFGTPSMGADGLVAVRYHFGSHVWFASLASLCNTSPLFSYPLGQTLVLIPWLYLSLFFATLCVAGSRVSAAFHVLLAIALVLAFDLLGWRSHYRSESYTFGLAVLAVSVPLYRDFALHPRRERRSDAVRLGAMFLLVWIGAAMKISVGFLLGVGFVFLVLRGGGSWRRTALVFAGFAVLALAAERWLRSLEGTGLSLSPFHFYLQSYPLRLSRWGPYWSLVPPLLYLGLVAVRRLRARTPLEPSERRTAELVLVMTSVAVLPGLLVALPSLDARWFQNTPQWLVLPLLAAGLWLPTPGARRLRAASALLLLVLLGATWSEAADAQSKLIHLAGHVLAETRGRPWLAARPDAARAELLGSLRRSGTLFAPATRAALAHTPGSHILAAVREARAATQGRLAVFVPPSNRAYWSGEGQFHCVQRALWIASLTGVPQLRGITPECRELRFYGFHQLYGEDSLNVELRDDQLCRQASDRGFDAVLVLQSLDEPALSRRLDCTDRALASPRRDLLLLVVDTLRADHLDLYGYPRPTAPKLTRFAESAIVFQDVFAPAPWTLPSVGSLLTGTYPRVHGLRARGGTGALVSLRPRLPTLAELLRDRGYRTLAVVSNPWVATPRHQLNRGFETFHVAEDSTADAMHDVARRLLAVDDPRPVFLYLHYMDVHGPYARPTPGEPDLGPVPERYRETIDREAGERMPSYLRIEGADRLETYVEAYDRGIRRWDAAFGRLLAWLERTGRLERSVVGVVSDHGEELLDHGGWNHGSTLYQEQLAIPWVLRVPGLRPRVVRDVVSLIDVAPTLLAAAGFAVPETMAGRDVLGPAVDATRTLFSETDIGPGGITAPRFVQVSLRRGSRKWVHGPSGDVCFDLERDAGERAPLPKRSCGDEVFAEIERWRREARKGAAVYGRGVPSSPTPEEYRKLRALGYLE